MTKEEESTLINYENFKSKKPTFEFMTDVRRRPLGS